ncbi:MAG TPA: hypothetical protein VEL77_12940 [Rugosimonospora sp.]|nr:hypothetical protein [Rugosimonospora sp.]
MSVEFRMMFVYHGCMMVLFMTGGVLTVKLELAIATILIAFGAAVSLRRRREKNWHWRSPGVKGAAMAIGTVLLMAFFLYAATPLFSPTRPQFFPWYLAGFGIGLFNVLSALNLVQSSEAEFETGCGERQSLPLGERADAQSPPHRIGWKQVVRGAFIVYFFAVWVTFVSSFYFYGKAFRGGSPTPTASQTEPMREHGKTVYVSPAEKRLVDLWENGMMVGIPSVFVLGFVIHFLLGVKLVDNAPTLRELLARRSGERAGRDC